VTAAHCARIAGLALALILVAATGSRGKDTQGVPDAAAADPEGPRVVLRWTATGEDDIYGYLVYRADHREGPFRRMNREIVHARPQGPDATSDYSFVDLEVEPGRTYFYYLDTVSLGGHKRRLSGVISKVVAGETGR